MNFRSINKAHAFVRLLILATLVLLSTLSTAAEKPVPPFEIEKLTRAPEFSLKDIKGATVSAESLRGKVVILNFWGTWCPACVAEMPSLQRLSKDKTLRTKGFEVIAIAVDSASDVRAYLKKKGIDITVLLDEDKAVSRKFKVFSLPTTLLISREGMIVEKFFGEYDWSDREIRQKIEKLL